MRNEDVLEQQDWLKTAQWVHPLSRGPPKTKKLYWGLTYNWGVFTKKVAQNLPRKILFLILEKSFDLKDHSSFCLSSVHWAMSSAIRNSLKSRKLLPSESNILKMWSQKSSALPVGNIFVKSSKIEKQLIKWTFLVFSDTIKVSSRQFSVRTLFTKRFEPKQNCFLVKSCFTQTEMQVSITQIVPSWCAIFVWRL